MASYITETFARMDLQRLREFILYGTSECALEAENYEAYDTRLKQAGDPIYNRINELYSDNSRELTEATNDLSQALSAHDEIYMEIGMKTGARLLYQLLLTENPIPPTQGNGGQNEQK